MNKPYHEYVKEVYQRIAPYIQKTPTILSPHFSQQANCHLYFKCENLQFTNAFKVRGAFSKMTNLSDKNKIIITASAGNHGLAIAFAARQFGMQAIVVVPEFVPQFRIDKIRELGAEIIIHGTNMDELNRKVAEYTQNEKYFYVHGFDDDEIIAGQATIAHELLQEIPDLDVIVVPVGGGGLISGIAQYAKSFNRNIRIYGAQTIGADAMSQSLQAGSRVGLSKITSIAISLGATKVGEKTFEIVKKHVTSVATVTDEEAILVLKEILENNKLLVEPASACALSIVLGNKISLIKAKKVAVILSGANFSLEQFKNILQ